MGGLAAGGAGRRRGWQRAAAELTPCSAHCLTHFLLITNPYPCTPPTCLPAQGLARLFDPLVAWMAPRYQAVVGRELKKYGLRYEDLYDPQMDLVSTNRWFLPGWLLADCVCQPAGEPGAAAVCRQRPSEHLC